MMTLEYEDVFSQDERTMFENRMPKAADIVRLKELIKGIKMAVRQDTPEGYNLAAKLLKEKELLISKTD